MLADCESWPQWWGGVERVDQLEAGDAQRVGSVFTVSWRAPVVPYRVPFDFHVDAVDEPRSMGGRANGALEGAGQWRLFEEDGVCAVTFDWEVRTTRAWMNALAPLARPLFTESHDRLMRRGGQDLARRLGVPLLAAG